MRTQLNPIELEQGCARELAQQGTEVWLLLDIAQPMKSDIHYYISNMGRIKSVKPLAKGGERHKYLKPFKGSKTDKYATCFGLHQKRYRLAQLMLHAFFNCANIKEVEIICNDNDYENLSLNNIIVLPKKAVPAKRATKLIKTEAKEPTVKKRRRQQPVVPQSNQLTSDDISSIRRLMQNI